MRLSGRRPRPAPGRRVGLRLGIAGLAAAGLGSLVAALGSAPGGAADAAAADGESPPRPNVVVVMTDDQDLASLRVMRKTRRLLGGAGARFENSFATFPLCCPARASFLTGRYAHNHGVLSNRGPEGGAAAFDDSSTLPVWLRRAGYRTAWIGKYLNGYGRPPAGSPRSIPPGWDVWRAPVRGAHRMYGYTLNENGRLRRFGGGARHYQTDLLARRARGFVRRSARGGGPFFLTLSLLAPHFEPGVRGGRNPRPAPRHARRFSRAAPAWPRSFDEQDVSDKPTIVAEAPRLGSGERRRLGRLRRDRLASLLAVDDAVAGLVRALRAEGELRRTLVVFTSDNGWMHGEHRLVGKPFLYEEGVRVPLLLRGPGVPRGVVRSQLAANVDLAPTILDATGLEPDGVLDGRSLLPFARNPRRGAQRQLLLEIPPAGVAGIRTGSHVLIEHPDDEVELYDLEQDPHQLESRHEDPSLEELREALERRLEALEDCEGAACG